MENNLTLSSKVEVIHIPRQQAVQFLGPNLELLSQNILRKGYKNCIHQLSQVVLTNMKFEKHSPKGMDRKKQGFRRSVEFGKANS